MSRNLLIHIFCFLTLIGGISFISAYNHTAATGPGLSIAANTTFFKKTISIVVPILIKEFKNYSKSFATNITTPFFNISFSLDSFNVTNVDLNSNTTTIVIANNSIFTTIADLSLICNAKVTFNSTPRVIEGTGTGYFNLSHFVSATNISFDLHPDNNLPMLHLYSSYILLNDKNLAMKFSGTHDIFPFLEMIQRSVIPMICNFINGSMSKDIMTTIENNINDFLGDLPNNITISGTNINVDYSLISKPVSNEKNFVPLAIKGESKCANASLCKKYNKVIVADLPPMNYSEGSGSFQVLVSDYMIDKLMVSLWEDNKLLFTITPEDFANLTQKNVSLDTDTVGVFMPQIRTAYGKKRNITLKLNVVDPPLIFISKEKIIVNASLSTELYVQKSDNSLTKALTLGLVADLYLAVSANKNKLKGNITSYQFTLKQVEQDPILNATASSALIQLCSMIFKILIPQINTHLNYGITLPLIQPYFNLNASSVTQLERYIRIDFNPEPIPKMIEEAIHLWLQNKELRRQLTAKTTIEERQNKRANARKAAAEIVKKLPSWLKLEL